MNRIGFEQINGPSPTHHHSTKKRRKKKKLNVKDPSAITPWRGCNLQLLSTFHRQQHHFQTSQTIPRRMAHARKVGSHSLVKFVKKSFWPLEWAQLHHRTHSSSSKWILLNQGKAYVIHFLITFLLSII